jgi:two-component system response regulator FixJ
MASQVLPSSDLFIVDDDAMMRDALSIVFTLAGYRVTAFTDAEAFLTAARGHTPACVLLDLHLPDKSGVTVLKEINAQSFPAPIFIVTGDDDVGCAVEAVKNGAFDYLVKPFDARSIVMRVGGAIASFTKRNAHANGHNGSIVDFPGQTLLTPREHEVLKQIAAGASNKEVGRQLGISPRTVEVHRARIMEKIGARNAADLVRIVLSGGNCRVASPSPEMVA